MLRLNRGGKIILSRWCCFSRIVGNFGHTKVTPTVDCCKLKMATTMLEVTSTVHGYHVYKRCWDATTGEVLQAEREEPRIVHNRYVVMLIKEHTGTIGHIPKKISKLCHSFLALGGEIEAVITGAKHLLMIYHKVAWMCPANTSSRVTEHLFKDSNMHLGK